MTPEEYPSETWRGIPGFPGYGVSSRGRVMSRPRKVGVERTRRVPARVLKPKTTRAGYLTVLLYDALGVSTTRTVHSLVAEAFLGPRPPGAQVLHGNGNPADCSVGNLRYGTQAENEADKIRHGTHPTASRDRCAAGHRYVEGSFRVRTRTRDGKERTERVCLICQSNGRNPK